MKQLYIFELIILLCAVSYPQRLLYADQQNLYTTLKSGGASRVRIFGGRIQIAGPKASQKPQKTSPTTYSIRPTSSSQRFVIVVTREPLRSDELKKSTRELGTSVQEVLEAQGYEIDSLSNRGATYNVQFRGYTQAPWQQVGTTAIRGTAKFVRTNDNLLIGSMLLCEPSQWDTPEVLQYKRAVSSATISTK